MTRGNRRGAYAKYRPCMCAWKFLENNLYSAIRKLKSQTTKAFLFVYDKSPRSKVKDECMDHKNMAHFVIHTLTIVSPGGWEPFAKHRN